MLLPGGVFTVHPYPRNVNPASDRYLPAPPVGASPGRGPCHASLPRKCPRHLRLSTNGAPGCYLSRWGSCRASIRRNACGAYGHLPPVHPVGTSPERALVTPPSICTPTLPLAVSYRCTPMAFPLKKALQGLLTSATPTPPPVISYRWTQLLPPGRGPGHTFRRLLPAHLVDAYPRKDPTWPPSIGLPTLSLAVSYRCTLLAHFPGGSPCHTALQRHAHAASSWFLPVHPVWCLSWKGSLCLSPLSTCTSTSPPVV